MKNTIFLLLLLVPIFTFAQTNTSSGTSLEEYRYLTKGYAYQAEMGLDAFKEGYDIKPVGKSKNNIKYIGLYKKDAKAPQALLLVFNSKGSTPTYICMPNNQATERVWDLYQADRKAITDPDIWEHLDEAMRDLTFQLMGQPASESKSATDVATESKSDEEKEKERLRALFADAYASGSGSGSGNKGQGSANDTKDKATNVEEKADELTAKGVIEPTALQNQKEDADVGEEEINPNVNIVMDDFIVESGVLAPPVIRGSYPAKGIIVIKFSINDKGEPYDVRYTMRGSTTYQETLKQMSLESVKNTKFAISDRKIKSGTVTFHYK